MEVRSFSTGVVLMLMRFCCGFLGLAGLAFVFAAATATPAYAVPVPVALCAGSCTGDSGCVSDSADCADNNNGKNNCLCDTGVTNKCGCE